VQRNCIANVADLHGAGLRNDCSVRVQGSLRSALIGRPLTRPRSAVNPAPCSSLFRRIFSAHGPLTLQWVFWDYTSPRVALLQRCSGVIKAVRVGVAFCVRSRCSSVDLPLRDRITSLSAALSPRRVGLTGIEGFS
jgi:hypothetical protein